jgi:hypothetical protein
MNSMALAFMTSPPLLMMNSMNGLGVHLDIIDKSYAPSP